MLVRGDGLVITRIRPGIASVEGGIVIEDVAADNARRPDHRYQTIDRNDGKRPFVQRDALADDRRSQTVSGTGVDEEIQVDDAAATGRQRAAVRDSDHQSARLAVVDRPHGVGVSGQFAETGPLKTQHRRVVGDHQIERLDVLGVLEVDRGRHNSAGSGLQVRRYRHVVLGGSRRQVRRRQPGG